MSATPPLPFSWLVIGISHHQAPLQALEKASVERSDIAVALRDLCSRAAVQSGLLLSTCNRVEVYALAEKIDDAKQLMLSAQDFFKQWCAELPTEVLPQVYVKQGDEAVHHLFSVAASLDSLVPGEAQILAQVKEAYRQVQQAELSHPLLDRLIRKALSVGKLVRSETDIGAQPLSIANAAIELARKVFGDLDKCKALLVGTGEMGQLAASSLKRRGIAELIIGNRTYEHAVQLAEEYNGTAIHFNMLANYLTLVDVVVVSTGAGEAVIDRAMVATAMRQRRGRPLFIIDIAMPRNVDPQVHTLENVYLYNIEDLKQVVQGNLSLREEHRRKAEDLVAQQQQQFIEHIQQYRFDRTIGDVRQAIGDLVQQELRRLLAQLGEELNEPQRQAVVRSFNSLVDKLSHHPVHFLKQEEDPQKIHLLRQVFGLNADEKLKTW